MGGWWSALEPIACPKDTTLISSMGQHLTPATEVRDNEWNVQQAQPHTLLELACHIRMPTISICVVMIGLDLPGEAAGTVTHPVSSGPRAHTFTSKNARARTHENPSIDTYSLVSPTPQRKKVEARRNLLSTTDREETDSNMYEVNTRLNRCAKEKVHLVRLRLRK